MNIFRHIFDPFWVAKYVVMRGELDVVVGRYFRYGKNTIVLT